jgi:hypothetical protein
LVRGADAARAQQALEQLCRSYWQPIYGFLRCKGFSPHEAEDLTQQFFFRLLQRNSVANADRAKGRFRNFLLGALTHFLTDELRKSSAQKRGGAPLPFAPDFAEAEERYLQEPDPRTTGLMAKCASSMSPAWKYCLGRHAFFSRYSATRKHGNDTTSSGFLNRVQSLPVVVNVLPFKDSESDRREPGGKSSTYFAPTFQSGMTKQYAS